MFGYRDTKMQDFRFPRNPRRFPPQTGCDGGLRGAAEVKRNLKQRIPAQIPRYLQRIKQRSKGHSGFAGLRPDLGDVAEHVLEVGIARTIGPQYGLIGQRSHNVCHFGVMAT